ncbi:MAG TPA: DUF4835 family protein [Ignavibacteriaceae bacterium]|nr:DUF4835 family protein [Ignavibacteriaceae bacterium]
MKYLIFLSLIYSSISFSQELNCKVSVNYEGLPVLNRELLTDFAGVIESYMNTTQFTSETWKGQKIDCSLNIFFTSSSGDNDYAAQVVVVSTRPIYKSTRQSPMITINDPTWSFRYVKNQALYPNQSTFDPITSFLDYYANIIIGFDWDTWAELGGTPFFKKAFDIVNLGNNSGNKKGWERSNATFSRWGLCEDLLNDKYRNFREALFRYYYGVDEYQVNKKDAQEKIVNIINVLSLMKSKSDINSVLIRLFFDTKYGEFIELLRDYPDVTIFRTLKQIDPSHAAKYDDLLE